MRIFKMILPIRNLYIYLRYVDKVSSYVCFFNSQALHDIFSFFFFFFLHMIRYHVNKMFLSSAFAYFKLLLKGDSFV